MSTDHVTDDRPLSEKAASVVRKLSRAGHEAYFAGGCVRDMVMGEIPKDYDITTAATPDQVQALFRRTVPIGAAFGVVQVHYGGAVFEVATFRTEHGYSDGRRPDRVEFASAREDVLRRDFTINGLLYDPARDEVIDWVSGRDDIRARVVRAIGVPDERFAEDRLRMLRAVRFAARFGFRIDEATSDAVRRHASGITTVSAERIREELVRTLAEGGAATGARLLDTLGLLDVVLPEVAALRPHGRLDHVLRVLDHLPPGDAIMGLAILLHEGSAEEAAQVAERLRLSRAEAERLLALVQGYRVAPEVPAMDRAARLRWLRAPHARSVLELVRLDARDGHGDVAPADVCEGELEALAPDELFPTRLLSGNDLKEMGHAPGPRFRVVLDALEDAQLRGEVATREQAVALVARLLEQP